MEVTDLFAEAFTDRPMPVSVWPFNEGEVPKSADDSDRDPQDIFADVQRAKRYYLDRVELIHSLHYSAGPILVETIADRLVHSTVRRD